MKNVKKFEFRQRHISYPFVKPNMMDYVAPRVAAVFIARNKKSKQIGACWLRYVGNGLFLPVAQGDLEDPTCEPAVIAPCAIVNTNYGSEIRDRNINLLYFRDKLYAHIMNMDSIALIECENSMSKIKDAICDGKINFDYPRRIRITSVLTELGNLWDED